MVSDLHLDLARGLLATLLDLLAQAFQNLVYGQYRHHCELAAPGGPGGTPYRHASTLVPLLDQVLMALVAHGQTNAALAPHEALRANLAGDRSVAG